MELYKRGDSPFWWFSAAVNGRRIRGSTSETRKGAARIIAEGKVTQARENAPHTGRWKVNQLLGTYLDGHLKHTKNIATATYQMKALAKYIGKDKYMADLTGADLIAYRARRKADGLGNSSINRELELFRAALRFVCDHFAQPMPPIKWKGLMFAEPPPRTRYLTEDEYERLLMSADDGMRAAIVFAVNTGLRLSNVKDLAWEQIDLANRRAAFITKGNKRQAVTINAPAMAAITTTPPDLRRGYVFDRVNWRKRWEAARLASGVPDFRWHDLRHTFATWARQSGVDLAKLQAAMNHSNVAMTMRYAHVGADEESAADAIARRRNKPVDEGRKLG